MVAPGCSFTVTVSPPMTFPLPGRIWMVVTPPARARAMAGSSRLTASMARIPAWLGSVISLPSELASTSGQE